jgi:hypothetical protein
MKYSRHFISENDIPRARKPIFQHLVDTYTSERIWVFWRQVLHTAHHRAQVGDRRRLLNSTVPVTYGPTADVTWWGADPTTTLDATRRAAP